MTIVEFLLDRIAEDEKRWTNPAFVRLSGPWLSDLVLKMRAECETKRRIVAIMGDQVRLGREARGWDNWEEMARQTLLALALPYADHPDFDESWRP